ncbi:MAG: RNA polymerase sigma factor [Bacteroidetes bacterium]|nr:MAG: RNA polymerase sigma factor [Bacteroidota bacterium]MBL1143751.1 sigma-70 family RNA polymerase sigma factor [Bacteroidota bacterium]MCB0802602.1 sigma-70 family RNA polymerase sigma factor [Flavobacteriales bacterium]NOG56552.1 sigma-70 family RNA polymerase sigma factor [Bacteroidota bacterium]
MTAIEFNTQLLSHQNVLKYFALKLTTDMDDAEDLLQETLLKALKYRDKFQDQTNLKSWLYTIMKNTFINNYRRNVRKRNIMTNTDDREYFVPAPNQSEISPESHYNFKEITKTVETLSDDCKIPFKMHNEGYKYKEIADELNLPIGTVKSRIFLARQKLTKALKDYAA